MSNSFGYITKFDDNSAGNLLTAKGDLFTRGATESTRLTVGTDGQVLTVASGQATGLVWLNPGIVSDGGVNNTLAGGTYGSTPTGANNTAYGATALDGFTSGANNTVIGHASGVALTTGSFNTLVGASTVAPIDATYSIALGQGATVVNNNEFVFGGSASDGTSITTLVPGRPNICDLGSTGRKFNDGHFNGTLDAAVYTVGGGDVSFVQTDQGGVQNYIVNSSNSLTSAMHSSFFGFSSGPVVTSGNFNTYYGNETGKVNINGNRQTFIGEAVGIACTVNDNTGVGSSSLLALTTGVENTAVGSTSGAVITTGAGNTCIGFATRVTTNSNTNCIALGRGAIALVSNQFMIGGLGGTAISTMVPAVTNTCSVGTSSLKFSTGFFGGVLDAASYSVGGVTSFIARQMGSDFVLTDEAHLDKEGFHNSFIGFGAGAAVTSANYATLVGKDAGTAITSAVNCTIIGSFAGRSLTASSSSPDVDSHTFVGFFAGENSNLCSSNTFIGAYCGRAVVGGSDNTFIGRAADGNSAGIGCTCIGKGSLGLGGNYSIALGWAARTTAPNQFMIGGTTNSVTEIRPAVTGNTHLGSTSFRYASGWVSGAIEAASYTTSGVAGGMFRTDKTSSYWFTDSAFAAEVGSANNVVVGVGAFPAVTSASLNVVVGNSAMSVAEAATGCVALGYDALGDNVNGHGNTAVGYSAGNGAVSSSDAVYIGNLAGASTGNSTGGVCIGSSSQIAGYDYSVALGYGATATANNQLVLGGTTNNITSIVTGVASNGTTGCNIGETGLKFKNGYFAGAIEAASYTVGGVVTYPPRAIATNGIFINGSVQGTTGSNNTVFGMLAGQSITEGDSNVLVGKDAGLNVILGGGNVCVGVASGNTISGGDNNVCVGRFAGNAIVGGSHNVCLGYNTDTGAAFTYSIALGSSAIVTAAQQFMVGGTGTPITEIRPAVNLATSLGSTSFRFSNVFTTAVEAASYTVGGVATYPPRSIGTDGIFINGSTQTLTNGVDNTVVGVSAGTAITSGTSNVLIGKDTGTLIADGFSNVCVGAASGSVITDGYNNVCIGRYAGNGITGGSNNVCVGYNSDTGAAFTNSIALGNTAIAGASREFKVGAIGSASVTAWLPGVTNEATLGNASFTFNELFCTNATINTSDLRKKDVHEEGPPGISFISALKPIAFNWKEGETDTTHFGFGAQDVEDVMDRIWGNSEWAGLVKSRVKDDNGDEKVSYGLRMTEFIAPVVQAIQELNSAQQESKNMEVVLRNEVTTLREEIEQLKSTVRQLVKLTTQGPHEFE
jgi:hypothetical protein